MINFGMVIFSNKEEIKKRGILFNLIIKISICNKKKIYKYIEIETQHLYGNLKISIIKLPFTIEDYFNFKDSKNRKIIWELTKIMKREGLVSCLFPLKFLEQNQFKSFDGSFYGKRDLFKLLAINECEIIIKKYIKEIAKLHILIIYENNAHELEGALNVALKYTNYIYVYAPEIKMVEDVVGVFRTETGAGVVVTTDLTNTIRIANVIFNYADSEKIFNNIQLKDKSIIFNFGKGFCNKINSDSNIIINDIDILNEKILDKIPVAIWEWFSKREFMNTVFEHLSMNYPKAHREYPNYQTLKVFNKIFTESGFKISGYYGRNNFTNL